MTDGGISCGLGCGGLGAVGLATIVAGGYKGYMDAKGLPIDPGSIDFAVTYGGTILQGLMLAVPTYFGVAGIKGIVKSMPEKYEGERWERFKEVFKKGAPGSGILAGGLGATLGALETIVSYAVGYGIGSIT